MSWLKRTFDSSIGGKVIVAVTGLMMVGFVIAHLSGNLLVFSGPEALAEYAEGLRKFPKVLWGLRSGLILATLLHVSFAIKLNLRNAAARPTKYVKKNYIRASFSSRTMVYTGLLVLFYAAFHLAHFTFRVTNPEISALGPWEVYKMLLIAFNNPLWDGVYIAAMVVLGLHLSHGISSIFQTLGINHPKYNGVIQKVGPLLGTLLAAGYISIPVAIMLGIVK